MTSNHPDEHVNKLIRYGIFNPEDLETNRRGHVSEMQKRKFHLRLSLWLFVVILDLAILIPFLMTKNAAMIALGLLLVTGLVYSCYVQMRPIWDDIQTDDVKSVAGSVNKKFKFKRVTKGSMRIGFSTIRVGHEVFSISPATYDQLSDNGFYRIYYVPHTRTIINIEPL